MKKKWFIGIDISKLKLDVTLLDVLTKKASLHSVVTNDIKGFQSMVKKLLKAGVILDEAFVCLEYCGVYGLKLGLFLEKTCDYCFCSPLQIKRSLGITRGKNDKLDALKIANYCYRFQDELKAQNMPSAVLLKLRSLLRERDRVVGFRKIGRQIRSDQATDYNKSTIARSIDREEQFSADIKEIEKEIEQTIKEDDSIQTNYSLLLSISGIGMINAVAMIICSNNFEGIDNARSFACYCGVAPFEYSSGSSIKKRTRVSKMANKQMKVYITNAARSAIVHDPELRLYYKKKREEGKSHGCVLNAVKFKLITRSYAVIKRGTAYVKLRNAG